jgi:hypothetical protein
MHEKIISGSFDFIDALFLLVLPKSARSLWLNYVRPLSFSQ